MSDGSFAFVRGPQPVHQSNGRRSVLFLYCAHNTFTRTVLDYLEAFPSHSRHQFVFEHATSLGRSRRSFDEFDAVYVHYSVRMTFVGCMDSEHREALRAYKGLKVLFLQDEYENTNNTRHMIEELGFQVVMSVVPPAELTKVYPAERFPNVAFYSILTGYVPDRLLTWPVRAKASERKLWLAYRGRPLHPVYGDLGQEKAIIGQRMKAECAQRGLPADIEWTEANRIYGDGWFDFLASARATLGTESGSNIFDDDGTIKLGIDKALKESRGTLPYAEAKSRFFPDRENRSAKMNQISPKMFEAIALRTALVLFEGAYSGILQPDVHYIPLKKDFSNVDEVFAKLADTAALETMAERAYTDIIASRRYSYETFVHRTDEMLERFSVASKAVQVCYVGLAVRRTDLEPWHAAQTSGIGPTTQPLSWGELKVLPRFTRGRADSLPAIAQMWGTTLADTGRFLVLWPARFLRVLFYDPLVAIHGRLPENSKRKLLPLTDAIKKLIQFVANPA